MRPAHAADIGEIGAQIADREPFAIGVAVAVDGADPCVPQCLDAGIGVVRRVVAMRPVVAAW